MAISIHTCHLEPLGIVGAEDRTRGRVERRHAPYRVEATVCSHRTQSIVVLSIFSQLVCASWALPSALLAGPAEPRPVPLISTFGHSFGGLCLPKPFKQMPHSAAHLLLQSACMVTQLVEDVSQVLDEGLAGLRDRFGHVLENGR